MVKSRDIDGFGPEEYEYTCNMASLVATTKRSFSKLDEIIMIFLSILVVQSNLGSSLTRYSTSKFHIWIVPSTQQTIALSQTPLVYQKSTSTTFAFTMSVMTLFVGILSKRGSISPFIFFFSTSNTLISVVFPPPRVHKNFPSLDSLTSPLPIATDPRASPVLPSQATTVFVLSFADESPLVSTRLNPVEEESVTHSLTSSSLDEVEKRRFTSSTSS
mmetsp:Transcript_20098/g.29548  ORF Transcript_20098/g.29548 Transcript_20098/m.29548 type:complete len:217 (-) Transcript_20098:576-1226(-)